MRLGEKPTAYAKETTNDIPPTNSCTDHKNRIKEAVESRKVTHLADVDGRLYPLMGWV